MLAASSNGSFQDGNYNYSPNFQGGDASGPPGGSQSQVRIVNPPVIHPLNLNPKWDDRAALDDLWSCVLFVPKDQELFMHLRSRKRKFQSTAIDKYYPQESGDMRVRDKMVMHNEISNAGALPHINFLLARAQAKYLERDATSAYQILTDVLPLYIAGVHNTDRDVNELNVGTLQQDGRYAPGRAPVVVNSWTAGQVDTYNIWNRLVETGEAVGFELYPRMPATTELKYRLSERGSFLHVDLNGRKIVWQIRPVFGPELVRGPNWVDLGDQLMTTKKWVIGRITGQTRYMRRSGDVDMDKVERDITEHLRSPTCEVQLNMSIV